MGIYVNPGNERFGSAVNSLIYVDKTGLIEHTNSVIGTEQRWICVSRARRFGKSIAADMLTAYYSKGADSKELFGPYKIAASKSYEKYLNQHNVIYLDIAYLRSQITSAMETVEYMQQCVIRELKEIYPDTIDEGEKSLPFAMAQVNKLTGARFIVIIDEWDALLRDDKLNKEAQDAYIDLLRGMFKGGNSKSFLLLAYITGILPIKRYNSESALNNFDEFTMTNPQMLSEYVGFTEDEVKELCQEYDMDFNEAKRWYDGYSFYNLEHVYGPNSVVKAMRSRRFGSYWTNTAAYESLKDYISMNFDGLKDCIIHMLAGGRCKVDVDSFENDMTSFKRKDDVMTLLIHLGYLAYDDLRKEAYIPNEEVKGAFYRAISCTNWTSVVDAYKASDALLRATWNKDAEAVAAGVDTVHMANTSILSYNDENALSCVITLAYYNAINEYILEREQPTGKGYADIIFRPRKYSDRPAMVIELKYGKSADEAIAQIKEKKYTDALQEYQGNILLVGINYDKETKTHSCIIEEG